MECGDEMAMSVREIKQEVLEEDPDTLEEGGYQVIYVKEEIEDEDSRQDGGEAEMQMTTESSTESVGNPSLRNSNWDSGWQLPEEDEEEDVTEGLIAHEVSAKALSIVEEPSGTSKMQGGNAKEKKVCLVRNLKFMENRRQRSKARSNRVKGIFKKAKELADITKCEVLLYLKDEFSKTIYWGTDDAMQLFQQTVDYVITKEDKCVRRVQFVTPSEEPSGDSQGTVPHNSVALDRDNLLKEWLGADAQNKESLLSSAASASTFPSSLSRSGLNLTPQESEPAILRRYLSHTKTGMPWINPRKTKVIDAKKLQFVENDRQRCKARFNRVKGIFKKAHGLAELTNCQVFLYVKDEFGKTTYWGTSDTLQLFQPTIDSVVTKGEKRVRSVNFVAPSKPSEDSQGTVPRNSEDPDPDKQFELVGRLGSDAPTEASQFSLTSASSSHSSAKSTPCASPPNSTPQELKSLGKTKTVTGTCLSPVINKEKRVFLAKKHQLVENNCLRSKARSRRLKGLFSKGYELAELTNCQVFLYVKDEFGKTTYWGTSDALQVFQPTIELLTRTEEKPLRRVVLVAPSTPCKHSQSALPRSSEDQDADELHVLVEWVESDDESQISSSTFESSEGFTSQLELTSSRSSAKSTSCTPKCTPENSATSLDLEAPVESESKKRMLPFNTREKKVLLARKLQFVENSRRRCKARSNRIKGLLKKGHQLAEITDCQVFIHVKTEISKTTYWGTSDALQLFQPTINALVEKGGKRVRGVQFVAPSKPWEDSQDTPP